ncbi:MAG: OmpA family protein [Pseudomonadota bacterium]
MANTHTLQIERNVRYWKRRDEPVGWLPWGLLWLLGLLVVFLVGALLIAPEMQRHTQTSVATMLKDYDAVTVDADGQHVMVSAEAPQDAETMIHALAANAQCDTWLGLRRCPVNVKTSLTAPVMTPRLHDFLLTRDDQTWNVSGEVGDDEARARFSTLANNDVSALSISGETATSSDAEAIGRATAIAALLQSGEVQWLDGVFSVRGTADRASADRITALFNRTENAIGLGDLNLKIPEVVSACNAQLAETLDGTQIRFATGSAAISPDSEALLRRLATILSDCPGSVTVDGHTDSVGAEDANLTLSHSRAASVATALASLGIEKARITSRGYGESSPIADNNTAAGRARNRRIVITID